MLGRLRSHLTYANVAATLALVIALAGGTAYAANTVFSSDIVNGEVKQPDIAAQAVGTDQVKNNQIGTNDIATDGVASLELKSGSVTGDEVRDDSEAGGGLSAADLAPESVGSSELEDGSIEDVDLDASAQGARAFGLVLGHSCGDPVGFCTIVRSKRVAYAAHVGTGKYCVGVNGINATDPGALAVVNPNLLVREAWAEWRGAFQNNSACVGSEFEIYTGRHDAGFVDNYFTILIP